MILTSLLMLVAAAQDPAVDCENAMAQPDLNACAYQEYERADAALNAQWKLTAAAMKAQDKGFDRSYDKRPGYYETLLAAQRAWLTYRDRQCDAEGYTMRGGSAEPMVISGCLATLTEARTAELKALIAEY
ncbi:lysozyme inhibitor LprI family protein [Sphingopyxis sp.]|uniref:lysozyme inhibitor LprI family protein n=1 Tax=Sphingopyxis sp. TaxID=1908224 RepID=UPI003D0C2D9D